MTKYNRFLASYALFRLADGALQVEVLDASGVRDEIGASLVSEESLAIKALTVALQVKEADTKSTFSQEDWNDAQMVLQEALDGYVPDAWVVAVLNFADDYSKRKLAK